MIHFMRSVQPLNDRAAARLEPWAGLNIWMQDFEICRRSRSRKIYFLALKNNYVCCEYKSKAVLVRFPAVWKCRVLFPFKNAGRCRLNQINQSAAGNSIMNDCLWSVYLDQCNNKKKKLTKQDVLYDVCSVIIALIQLIMFKLWLSFDLRERNVKFT